MTTILPFNIEKGKQLKSRWDLVSLERSAGRQGKHTLELLGGTDVGRGMRWGEQGSDAVAHLRALYRSDPDQWDGFWRNAA